MVSVSSIPKIDRHYSDSHKILQILLLSFSCNSVVMNNKDLTKVVDTKCSKVHWKEDTKFLGKGSFINDVRFFESFLTPPLNPIFSVFLDQDFLNGPVKDCMSQSYTDRFKTKRRFITKNANVAKLDSFIYRNPWNATL